MSSPEYWTILTPVGRAKVANAIGTGLKINVTKFAVGDGHIYPDSTSLSNEIFRGLINTSTTVPDSASQVELVGIVPASEGGFFVREAAFFTDDDEAFAIVRYPETYKPSIADNASAELGVKAVIDVLNSETVQLKIDPSMVYATQEYVNNQLNKLSGLLSLDGGAFSDTYPDVDELDGGIF